MKKSFYIGLIALTLLVSNAFCSELDNFTKKMQKCSYAVYEDGATIYQVIGWVNGLCQYREFTPEAIVKCSFNSEQLNEYVKVVKTQREKSVGTRMSRVAKMYNKEIDVDMSDAISLFKSTSKACLPEIRL